MNLVPRAARPQLINHEDAIILDTENYNRGSCLFKDTFEIAAKNTDNGKLFHATRSRKKDDQNNFKWDLKRTNQLDVTIPARALGENLTQFARKYLI